MKRCLSLQCLGLIFFLGIALAGCNSLQPPVASVSSLTPRPSARATRKPSLTPTATLEPSSTFAPTLEPSSTSTATPTATVFFDPEAALKNGPYLQSVSRDSIIVAWNTDLVSSQWSIAYGVTSAYSESSVDASVGTAHALKLTGLAPFSLYHYRLENSDGPQSEDFTFRTAADPNQPYRFAVFGDTHTNQHIDVPQLVALQPDFALHTGDLVDLGTDAAQWDTFLATEHDLMARVPVFPTLGNHEAGPKGFLDTFHLPGNGLWYSFDYGNARFVCLASDGTLFQDNDNEQLGWLQDVLAHNTQPWLIVFFHIPPYDVGPSTGAIFETAVGKDVMPLFEQYGVDLVFNGHTHIYDQKLINGVQYMTTGGFGDPFYLVTVEGKKMTVKAISNGNTLNVYNLSIP